MLLVQLIITAMFAGLVAYLETATASQSGLWIKILIPIIAAILIVLSDYLIDKIGLLISKPLLTVEISRSTGEIDFGIEVQKGSVSRIAIDYPVLGTINSFQNLNSVTDAEVQAEVIGGSAPEGFIQNNLQLSIINIYTGTLLSYKAFYTPATTSISLAGTDRYKLTYIWNYNGKDIQETEWYTTDGNKKTTPPAIKTMGSFFLPGKVLTPEEIQKIYQEGPPRENL